MKRISIAAALAFAAACLSFAQPAQPAPAPAIVNILPVTDNLDKAEEFYHRLLGLESEIGDPRARLAWYPQAPFLDDMYGVKGNKRSNSAAPKPSDWIRMCKIRARYSSFSW
jgi:hypothetical protein